MPLPPLSGDLRAFRLSIVQMFLSSSSSSTAELVSSNKVVAGVQPQPLRTHSLTSSGLLKPSLISSSLPSSVSSTRSSSPSISEVPVIDCSNLTEVWQDNMSLYAFLLLHHHRFSLAGEPLPGFSLHAIGDEDLETSDYKLTSLGLFYWVDGAWHSFMTLSFEDIVALNVDLTDDLYFSLA